MKAPTKGCLMSFSSRDTFILAIREHKMPILHIFTYIFYLVFLFYLFYLFYLSFPHLRTPLVDYSPYYTMRFLYFALVMKPSGNEMYMSFHQNLINMGSYLLIIKIFSRNPFIISERKTLLPTHNPLRVPTQTQAKNAKCNMGFSHFFNSIWVAASEGDTVLIMFLD